MAEVLDATGIRSDLRPTLNIQHQRLSTAEMLEEDGFATSKKPPTLTDYNNTDKVETLKKNESEKQIDLEAIEKPISIGFHAVQNSEQF